MANAVPFVGRLFVHFAADALFLVLERDSEETSFGLLDAESPVPFRPGQEHRPAEFDPLLEPEVVALSRFFSLFGFARNSGGDLGHRDFAVAAEPDQLSRRGLLVDARPDLERLAELGCPLPALLPRALFSSSGPANAPTSSREIVSEPSAFDPASPSSRNDSYPGGVIAALISG